MKTWTMPRVMIEGFVANDYVAACKQILPVESEGGYWYWDWDKDGKYDTNPNESFTRRSGEPDHMCNLGGVVEKGKWYTNQTIYQCPYLRQGDYLPATVYTADVFMLTNSNAIFYTAGEMDTSTSPTYTKNYS